MKVRFLAAIGFILLIIGGAICLLGLFRANFKLSALESEKLVEQNVDFPITNNIKIDISTIDLKINVSEDITEIHIKYYEGEYTKYTITNENGEILIKQTIEGKPWYKHVFNFGFLSYTTEVIIPKQVYDNISITGTTGNIKINDLEALELDVNITTGNCNLVNTNISNQLKIVATTGNIDIKNTVANKSEIKLTTGNITINDSNFGEGNLKCTTGNMKVTNCQFVKLVAESSTGNIRTFNLICADIYAKATTGNIKLEIAGKISDYKISVDRTTGNSNVNNKNDGDKLLTVIVRTGNIRVTFLE